MIFFFFKLLHYTSSNALSTFIFRNLKISLNQRTPHIFQIFRATLLCYKCSPWAVSAYEIKIYDLANKLPPSSDLSLFSRYLLFVQTGQQSSDITSKSYYNFWSDWFWDKVTVILLIRSRDLSPAKSLLFCYSAWVSHSRSGLLLTHPLHYSQILKRTTTGLCIWRNYV